MKAQTEPRHRIDWVRLQRDYATGRFTDRELAEKYDTARSVVNRRRKADRAKSAAAWPIDRSEDVKRATAALLMHEQVSRNVATGADSESVLAAATMAKDVILRHRAAARRGREVTNSLLAELADVTEHRQSLGVLIERASGALDEAEAASLAAQLRELVKLHNRVSSMQKLADAMARVQTLERRAFGIGDDDAGTNPLDTMNEGELQAEVDRLTQQMRERA